MTSRSRYGMHHLKPKPPTNPHSTRRIDSSPFSFAFACESPTSPPMFLQSNEIDLSLSLSPTTSRLSSHAISREAISHIDFVPTVVTPFAVHVRNVRSSETRRRNHTKSEGKHQSSMTSTENKTGQQHHETEENQTSIEDQNEFAAVNETMVDDEPFTRSLEEIVKQQHDQQQQQQHDQEQYQQQQQQPKREYSAPDMIENHQFSESDAFIDGQTERRVKTSHLSSRLHKTSELPPRSLHTSNSTVRAGIQHSSQSSMRPSRPQTTPHLDMRHFRRHANIPSIDPSLSPSMANRQAAQIQLDIDMVMYKSSSLMILSISFHTKLRGVVKCCIREGIITSVCHVDL
eukprot:TRINITY_DN5340_c1_g1_i10.p1 TRINITY_DN5340_c1_g1~~TRINITY_DN5340_c1_g1_i10.p1  ORF type:complete len:345 (-),score=78.54 TRINITY_DN5340_c1_g1_i10:69-1103(-)